MKEVALTLTPRVKLLNSMVEQCEMIWMRELGEIALGHIATQGLTREYRYHLS